MKSNFAFRLTQGFYHLFLGVWVGAMVMLAVTAAITFRTVRDFRPALNGVSEEPVSQMIAGGIVGNVLQGLAVISGVCAGVVAVCLVLQFACFRDRLERAGNSWLNAARVVLLLFPIMVFVWNVVYLTPEIHAARAEMYDLQKGVMDRAIAKDRFDFLHKLSERVVGGSVFMLAAAALLSPFAFTAGAALPAKSSSEEIAPQQVNV